jgi:hypothetical protein
MSKKKNHGVTADQIIEAAQVIANASKPQEAEPIKPEPEPIPEADVSPIIRGVVDHIASMLRDTIPGVELQDVMVRSGSIDGKFFDAHMTINLSSVEYDNLLLAVKDSRPVPGQPGRVELQGILSKPNGDKVFRFVFWLNTPDEISGRNGEGESPEVMEV